MKVFQVEDAWTRENLRLSTRPDPQPGAGEVRVAMRATALNYRDLLVPRRGYGARMQTLPLIMLSDGVGVVDAVGTGVTTIGLGDRVCPLFFQTWPSGPASGARLARSLGCEIDGTMADYRVFAEAGVAKIPAHLDDPQAATLPTAAVTAWRALISEGGVGPGDTVLVQGTGGVALFGLQFARMAGCKVIVTSSSDEKLARACALGADATINYQTVPDWGRRAREIAGGDGVDHVLEIGGEKTLDQSLRAVRTGGTISLIGVLSGGRMATSLGLIVTRHVRLQGITVGSRDDVVNMAAAIDQHKMQPVVDRVFPFAALHEALDYLASGRHFGKVCLRI